MRIYKPQHIIKFGNGSGPRSGDRRRHARKERGLVEADGGVHAYTIMRDVPQATLCDALETGREREAHRCKLSGAGRN